ncbi:MAG TPA: phosphomethylpyrimidine synthase ThiC, partial [Gammaproteobacteria bacterium]|nr:phosphomethylpyrimidine synthase ThiC [Gammaproteobacteria bacterium]
MSQTSKTLTSMSSVKEAFIKPFPNSNKIYVEGSRSDIQVPMREITLTDTIGELAEKNEPIHVYDTSGVYTDPSVQIDLRKGLSNIRENWINERADTEMLEGMSSDFSNERLDNAKL